MASWKPSRTSLEHVHGFIRAVQDLPRSNHVASWKPSRTSSEHVRGFIGAVQDLFRSGHVASSELPRISQGHYVASSEPSGTSSGLQDTLTKTSSRQPAATKAVRPACKCGTTALRSFRLLLGGTTVFRSSCSQDLPRGSSARISSRPSVKNCYVENLRV